MGDNQGWFLLIYASPFSETLIKLFTSSAKLLCSKEGQKYKHSVMRHERHCSMYDLRTDVTTAVHVWVGEISKRP